VYTYERTRLMSYTAPRVTLGQLQEEISSMTPEETQSVESDKKGTHLYDEGSRQDETEALRDLERAILCLPENDREELLRVRRICPELMENESDPILFLRCENYDMPATANRLAKYWKLRCKLFGERAFRPLTQTGDGALLPEDIAFLRLRRSR